MGGQRCCEILAELVGTREKQSSMVALQILPSQHAMQLPLLKHRTATVIERGQQHDILWMRRVCSLRLT